VKIIPGGENEYLSERRPNKWHRRKVEKVLTPSRLFYRENRTGNYFRLETYQIEAVKISKLFKLYFFGRRSIKWLKAMEISLDWVPRTSLCY
jgi:hypothetical protein